LVYSLFALFNIIISLSQGFIQLGGKFPQSVLLVGLPGSGKKMSARAIAREAGVHFFPCNARVLQESEYDAEWVKDMFKDAKRSPCVVFIDEIDAIGQNPKDQSLKQVIDELNGIRENEKIIVIGATNNPNALDMSLLRHGLFDRRIIIPYPDIDGRRKFLESHLSKVWFYFIISIIYKL
jgi:ATP-dependent Zn protease